MSLPLPELAPEHLVGRERVIFAARIQAQFSLPYSATTDTYWMRQSGPMWLAVEAGMSRRLDGTLTQALPFGQTPRLLLMWLTTQAVLTDSPVIDLGDSLRGFVNDVGLTTRNSHQRSALLDQLRRLIALRYTFGMATSTDTNAYELMGSQPVTERAEIYFSKGTADTQEGLLTSEITLSQTFFEQFVRQHAIPVRPEHLRALARKGTGGLALDVYLWLTYRTHHLGQPLSVTWAQLESQFGGDYARTRDFRRYFQAALKQVQAVHEDFRVQASEQGVLLYPSKAPVSGRRKPIAR